MHLTRAKLGKSDLNLRFTLGTFTAHISVYLSVILYKHIKHILKLPSLSFLTLFNKNTTLL